MRLERSFEVRAIEGDEPGRFQGYASAFGVVDAHGTVFDKGAFKKTVKERKGWLPIVWMHRPEEPIGRAEIKEDEKGLWVDGTLDLDVQRGKEVYSGMKKGYITQMSHSFRSIKEKTATAEDKSEIPHFLEVQLYEVSPVTSNFASNEAAMITGVRTEERGVIPSNLPLASKDVAWDAGAANKRVQAWAKDGDDVSMAKYRKAFLWVDGDGENLTDYKFPIGDVIDGGLKAIPRAIYAAAGRINQAKGVDVDGIKAQLAKYYKKLGETAPWDRALMGFAFQAGRLSALLSEPRSTHNAEPQGKPGDHLRAFLYELDRLEHIIEG